MKTLVEITNALQENQTQINFEREYYEKKLAVLIKDRNELIISQKLLLADIDLEKVETANRVLDIQGNILSPCGTRNEVIAELAALDIAAGCKHLKLEYFGNKVYSGFYQREDHRYGFGPSYGSIVERVGLRNPSVELTEDEKEASIYMLLNFKKISQAFQCS